MLLNGIHHVMVKVHDFDKSVVFYETLGAKMTHIWGDPEKRCALLDIGGQNLELISGAPEEPQPVGPVNHIAFRTEDCAACVATAVGAGARITREMSVVTIPAKPEPLVVRLAFVAGPDNESLEFFQIIE